jgi:hypothetical protein
MIKLSSLCPIPTRWNNPDKTAHFKEPFLHIIFRHDEAKPRRTHYVWIREGHIGTTYCYRAPNALKTLDPGAAAHMSLHLNQQCQRAQKTDALPNPFLLGRSGAWRFDDHISEPSGPSLR